MARFRNEHLVQRTPERQHRRHTGFTEGFLQLQASRPVFDIDANDTFHREVEQYEGSDLRVGGSRVSTYLSVAPL